MEERNRKSIWKSDGLYILILVATIVFCISSLIGKDIPERSAVNLNKLSFSGVMLIEGKQEIPYESKDVLKGIKVQNIKLDGHFNDEIPRNIEILLKIENINCAVYVNEQRVFDNAFEDAEYWDTFKSPGITSEDNVVIYITSKEGDASNEIMHLMNNIYSGSRYELLKIQIKKYRFSIILSGIVFIFGIAVLVVAVILSFMGFNNAKAYGICGILSISGSMCAFINYDYMQLIIPQVYFIRALDMSVQVITSTALLVYLRCYLQKSKNLQITRIISYIWVVIILNTMLLAMIDGRVSFEHYGELMITLIVFVAIELSCLMDEYSMLENREIRIVFVGSGILAVGTMFEILHYVLTDWFWYWTFDVGLIVFVAMQLAVLISISKKGLSQAMRVKEMEKELIQANINTMVSQIQPHFLYNALGTIRALITIDPQKAGDVVDHFSRYLRSNMESLTQRDMIPFEQELEHVRNYLYIEKVRFGNKLNVEYDLMTKEFLCPGLSLQTMVENAVKHGLGDKKGGGTVQIKTIEDRAAFYIVVEDDGVGFDMKQKPSDGRTHVGMENTKQRLRDMAHGELIIESTVGVGTRVTMKLPKSMK